MVKKKLENLNESLVYDNSKNDFLNKYFSYFLEQNILIFNQCNSKSLSYCLKELCVCVCVCDGCPLGFERDHLLYLMSFPLSPTPPLKLYVFVDDSSGQLSCDRFCHRIGTTDQFCLQ